MTTERYIPPESRVFFRSRWPGKLLFWAAYLAFLYLLLEGTARTYWTLRWKMPFFRTGDLKRGRFYNEVRKSGVLATRVTKEDGFYDILLLGGSVLTDDFGDIAPRLRRKLETDSKRKLRIFNCAGIGKTTRDSLIKYQQLASQSFDLLFVYEGLNDVSLSNCPPERFKTDYTHNSWYYRLSRLDAHREIAWTVLPFTCEYLVLSILEKPSLSWCRGRNHPQVGWQIAGDEVLTGPSFRQNLTELIELARKRGAAVFLTTYGWYIPPDYNLAAFEAHALDYARHINPIETWGKPENVRKGLVIHNQIIRELAREQGTLFVDLEPLIPRSRQNFNDMCHLTPDGCQFFVDQISPLILEQIKQTK